MELRCLATLDGDLRSIAGAGSGDARTTYGIVANGQSVRLYPGGGITALEIQYLLEHWYIQVNNLMQPGF